MNRFKNILVFNVLMAMGSGAVFAQTNYNYVTVTNYVVVTITNIVILTNASPAAISVTAPVVLQPNKPAAPVKYSWNNSVSAGLTLARGNSDTTLFSADYQAEKKTPWDEYNLSAGLSYGEQDSATTVDNYKAGYQWNHLFNPLLYDYLRINGLRDYIADVTYRITLGPGVGYYFIKETNTTLSVEGGFNFESQELGDSVQNFATARLAEKYEHKFFNRARVWQSVEIFPQVDKLENYVVNFEIGAEAAISKSFSLKTVLDDSYNNRPAQNRLKNDLKLVAGVAYKF